MIILANLPKKLPKTRGAKVRTVSEMIKATNEVRKIIEEELKYVENSKLFNRPASI